MNITFAANEKKGGLCGKDHMQDYVEDLTRDWDLIDLKPKAGRFTWSNHKVGVSNISARLEIFLVHSTLMDGKIIS